DSRDSPAQSRDGPISAMFLYRPSRRARADQSRTQNHAAQSNALRPCSAGSQRATAGISLPASRANNSRRRLNGSRRFFRRTQSEPANPFSQRNRRRRRRRSLHSARRSPRANQFALLRRLPKPIQLLEPIIHRQPLLEPAIEFSGG